MLDAAHAVFGEKFGKDVPLQNAVLNHVGHSRGGSEIVLEHEILAFLVPHQVDARDIISPHPRRPGAPPRSGPAPSGPFPCFGIRGTGPVLRRAPRTWP